MADLTNATFCDSHCLSLTGEKQRDPLKNAVAAEDIIDFSSKELPPQAKCSWQRGSDEGEGVSTFLLFAYLLPS